MSFLLFTLLTCGAALSGALAGGLLRRRAADAAKLSAAHDAPLALGPGDPPTADADPLPGFTLGLGDVLTRGGSEAVLGGAYVLREEGVVLGALFTSLGPRGGPLVMAFPPPADEVFWLRAVDDEPALAGPLVLEIGGGVVELSRRLPVTLTTVGDDTTFDVPLAGEGTLFEYRGDAGRCALVLVAGAGRDHGDSSSRRGVVAHGTVLASGTLDRLPGPFRAE